MLNKVIQYFKDWNKVIIETSKIRGFDISHLCKYTTRESNRDFQSDGEHYRLLAYISTLFDNKLIIELGTRHGASAIALSNNPTNKVITYDIHQWTNEVKKDNIDFRLENILDTDAHMQILLDSFCIFVDTDPHDGNHENNIYSFLKRNDYKGIIIFDDTKDYHALRTFADSVDVTKYDLTEYAHFSGTLLVDFSGKVVIR